VPKQTSQRLLGAFVQSLLATLGDGPKGLALRTQAAVIRSLVAEIDHHPASDLCGRHLREQLKGEFVRLTQFMTGHRTTALTVSPDVPADPRMGIARQRGKGLACATLDLL
jgi:hypothetical protein